MGGLPPSWTLSIQLQSLVIQYKLDGWQPWFQNKTPVGNGCFCLDGEYAWWLINGIWTWCIYELWNLVNSGHHVIWIQKAVYNIFNTVIIQCLTLHEILRGWRDDNYGSLVWKRDKHSMGQSIVLQLGSKSVVSAKLESLFSFRFIHV